MARSLTAPREPALARGQGRRRDYRLGRKLALVWVKVDALESKRQHEKQLDGYEKHLLALAVVEHARVLYGPLPWIPHLHHVGPELGLRVLLGLQSHGENTAKIRH